LVYTSPLFRASTGQRRFNPAAKDIDTADMVAKSLAKVGIKKRGGKKPFVADTILKAFSNVTLG
jgi:hypothetical protein